MGEIRKSVDGFGGKEWDKRRGGEGIRDKG